MLEALKELADRHRPVAMAGERTLPVLDALRPLLPGGGLRRGATVGVTGSTAVLLALLAGPSAAGSWCAAVGLPWLGIVAAAELGIALDRFALVPYAGREWATTVAALLDGFDVVATRVPARLSSGDARRLAARARERGAVLLAVGEGWPGADIRVRAGPSRWMGLGCGHGRLQARYLPVAVEGRGAAARPRHTRLWLPAPLSGEDIGVAPGPGLPRHQSAPDPASAPVPVAVDAAAAAGAVVGPGPGAAGQLSPSGRHAGLVGPRGATRGRRAAASRTRRSVSRTG